jgi:hypothetical protein
LDWLQTNGRLIARDFHEPDFLADEAEISDFLGGEDGIGDLDYVDSDDIGMEED